MITRRLQKRALEEKRISVFAEDQRLLADMPVEEFKVRTNISVSFLRSPEA